MKWRNVYGKAAYGAETAHEIRAGKEISQGKGFTL
jgi:hypothetical protein